MSKLFTMATLVSAIFLSMSVIAQTPDMDGPRSQKQVLALGLYPPNIIMRHQQILGITPAQRKKMLGLVKAFQNDVAELQWNLQNEQQLMRQALSEESVDSAKALPVVEKVLDLESQFKLAHFRLLISIKNELTEKQIAMIQERVKRRNQRN